MSFRRWVGGGVGVAASLAALALLFQACSQVPPSDLDDLCAIFDERPEWRDAARASQVRWGVEVPTLLAFIHQESRFRADARPGYQMWLGVIPVGRRSSAYGYGQVKQGTWDDYRRATGNDAADRDEMTDAVDFVGWYGDVIHRSARVAKDDPFHLYLAYHEGPGGFARRSFDAKPWLLGVAHKVQVRSELYARQWANCGGPPVPGPGA